MWLPTLPPDGTPVFQRIASALVNDINQQKLPPGTVLPTMRALADSLGVTVGTVARAYQEAARTGLVEASGRRGTRVSPTQHTPVDTEPRSSTIDLRGHRSASTLFESELRAAFNECADDDALGRALDYHLGAGLESHRLAGAGWFGVMTGHQPDAANIVVTNGAQHALSCCLFSLAKPGEVIATEELTYTGLKSVAAAQRLTLRGLQSDEQGILPGSLEDAVAKHGAKVLVCVPDNHNPTSLTWSEERRQVIADLVNRLGIWLIEDCVYSGLAKRQYKSLAPRIHGRGLRITGLSKTVSPGARMGYIDAPTGKLQSLCDAVRATSWMASPITAQVVTQMISSGAAQRVLEENRTRYGQLNRVAVPLLEGLELGADPASPHLWVELPEPWTNEQAVQQLRGAGLLVSAADDFATTRTHTHHGIRISLCAARNDASLAYAARLIRSTLLDGTPLRALAA